MTAKHRKGKNSSKQEDNFFKNDVVETEVHSGGHNYTLLLVLVLGSVIAVFMGVWFFFQQHQTLTHLSDSLTGIQMRISKLQSSHEEMRLSNSKLQSSESVETRLKILEDSYMLAQKQVGMAMATAEQLKMSDLPSQVLSLHTEMKARLMEMQQATVSLEQMSQLQSVLRGKSEEFEEVRVQVEGLATLSGELSQKVEVLTGSLGELESKLEEKAGQIDIMSSSLDGQVTEMLGLKSQLDTYQAQLDTSKLEITTVREPTEREQSGILQEFGEEELLDTLMEDAPALEEDISVETGEGEEDAASTKEEEEEEAGKQGVAFEPGTGAETGTANERTERAAEEHEVESEVQPEENAAEPDEEAGALEGSKKKDVLGEQEEAGSSEQAAQDKEEMNSSEAVQEEEKVVSAETLPEEEVEDAEKDPREETEASVAQEEEETEAAQEEEEMEASVPAKEEEETEAAQEEEETEAAQEQEETEAAQEEEEMEASVPAKEEEETEAAQEEEEMKASVPAQEEEETEATKTNQEVEIEATEANEENEQVKLAAEVKEEKTSETGKEEEAAEDWVKATGAAEEEASTEVEEEQLPLTKEGADVLEEQSSSAVGATSMKQEENKPEKATIKDETGEDIQPEPTAEEESREGEGEDEETAEHENHGLELEGVRELHLLKENQQDEASEDEPEEEDETTQDEDLPEDKFICLSLYISSLLQWLCAPASDLPKGGIMQAFVPRAHPAPVRDEDAESQRKAKSQQARQTRRSTQGVTLTDIKEAQTTYSLSHQNREKEEGALDHRSSPWRDFTDAKGDTTAVKADEVSLKWNITDKEGNVEHQVDTLAESSNSSYLSWSASCASPNSNSSFGDRERWWRDENENVVEDRTQLSAKYQIRESFPDTERFLYTKEHDRLLRYNSSGESAADKAVGRTGSYTRRETRLASLNRQEQDSTAKDYKKMYADALEENERLKSKLQDSKQELVKIRSQLEKLTQRHDRISERPPLLESEKREKQALEKRVSDMEEEIKILTELKSDNQRLKDENGALIRVISKLSK